MLCFLILLFLTLALQFERLSEYAMEHFYGFNERITNPEFVKNLALLSGLSILTFGFFIFFLRKKIAHTRVYRKLKILVLYFWQGLISLKHMKKRWLFILYTVGLWMCYYLMAYIVFFAVSETSNLPMSAGLACMVFGTIGIVVTPGGIGLYPVIIANTLLLYGIAEPIGFALGWLIWTSQNILVVIGGLLALVLMPMVNQKSKVKNIVFFQERFCRWTTADLAMHVGYGCRQANLWTWTRSVSGKIYALSGRLFHC
jgi:hypothetical protein